MKKKYYIVIILLAGWMAFVSLPTSKGSLDYSKAEIVLTARKFLMKVNSQPIKLDVSPIWDTQTRKFLIPLRPFASLLNYKITWDQSSRTATFSQGGSSFKIKLYDKKAVLTTNPSISRYQTQVKNNRILLDSTTIETLMKIKSSLDTDILEITFYTDRSQIYWIAPDFTLKDIPGKSFNLNATLKSGKYKLVIINFYATRCPICAKALPNLEKFYEDYKNKGVLVVGINTDTQNMEKDRDEIIAKYNLTYPILLDKNADIYTLYSVSGIPNLFIVNQNSEIIQHQLGVEPDYFTYLRSFTDSYLKK
jgi:peroxiredoxin